MSDLHKDISCFLVNAIKTTNSIFDLLIKDEVLYLKYSIEEKIKNAVETTPDIIKNTDISKNNFRVKFCNVYLADDTTKTPVGFFKSESHIITKDFDKVDPDIKKRGFTTTHKTIVLDNVPGFDKNSAIFGNYCYYSVDYIPNELPIIYTAHSSDKTFANKTVRVELNKLDNKIGTITIYYKPKLFNV